MLNIINRLLNKPRELNKDEIMELQDFHRIAASYRFVAEQIKGNTALIPDGKKAAEQFEAIAKLMENLKVQWISRKLAELGYKNGQPVSLNLITGKIKLTGEKPNMLVNQNEQKADQKGIK